MKKTILLLMCISACCVSFAQTKQDELEKIEEARKKVADEWKQLDLVVLQRNLDKNVQRRNTNFDNQFTYLELAVKNDHKTLEQCTSCEGRGHLMCNSNCNGTGLKTCTLCYKTGNSKCMSCNGKGTISSGLTCDICKGSGETQCIRCKGTGSMVCGVCNATGRLVCTQCRGTGLVVQKVKVLTKN